MKEDMSSESKTIIWHYADEEMPDDNKSYMPLFAYIDGEKVNCGSKDYIVCTNNGKVMKAICYGKSFSYNYVYAWAEIELPDRIAEVRDNVVKYTSEIARLKAENKQLKERLNAANAAKYQSVEQEDVPQWIKSKLSSNVRTKNTDIQHG